MTADLPPLQDADQLGRGIFESKVRDQARRGRIRHTVFLEKEEVESLSVDRLDHAPDEEMAEIGNRNARLRGPNRSFYGWASLTVIVASQNGRTVRATPKLDNIYHADIDLKVPQSIERRDVQKEHANSLASAAIWRERPQQETGGSRLT